MAYTLDEETPKPTGVGFQAPADQPGVAHINNTTPTDYPTGPTPTMDAGGRQTDRFINFSRIFNANAEGARNAATQLANRVTRQGQAARGALEEGQRNFNHDADAGSAHYNGETVYDSTNKYDPHSADFNPDAPPKPEFDPNKKGDRLQPVYDPTTDPSSSTYVPYIPVGAKPGEVDYDAAVKNSNAKYSGPLGWSDEKVQAQTMDAAGQARGVADFNQRQALLGNSKLNSALVGGAGGKSFANIAKAFGGLDTAYDNQVSNDTALAGDASRLSDTAASRWGGALDTYDNAHADDWAKDAPATLDKAGYLNGVDTGNNTAANGLMTAFDVMRNIPGVGEVAGVLKGVMAADRAGSSDQKAATAAKLKAQGLPDPWNGNYAKNSVADPNWEVNAKKALAQKHTDAVKKRRSGA